MTPLANVPTQTTTQVDNYHGELIADPYRWLEDTDAPETTQWVNQQNERTEAFLAAWSTIFPHNVTPGTHYPPTLVVTGDHDDRVVPGHSFKFAAALQDAQPPDDEAPVLIRIETSTGHGHGKPTSKAISECTDVLAFLETALGR